MKWYPRKLEEERKRIFYEVMKLFPDDEIQWDELDKAFKDYTDKYGSEEAKAFYYYNRRFGDEGELYDIDGSFIQDKDGCVIQDWECNEDGYLRDGKGNRIYYKDGSPVTNIIMPDVIRKLYIEELEEDGVVIDEKEINSIW